MVHPRRPDPEISVLLVLLILICGTASYPDTLESPVSRLLPTPSLSTVGAAVAALCVAVPTMASAAICNKYCDSRDPGQSPGDRVPVTASIYARTLALHFDDTDAMGWASIDNGSPGDEVWLDRSFDGGRTWASGSKLGSTVPCRAVPGLAHPDVQRGRLVRQRRRGPARLRQGR